MDPAEDCLIKLSDAVCCQEDDAFAILQLAEEDRDKTVAD